MRFFLLLFSLFIFFLSSCIQREEGIKPTYRDVTEGVYSTVVLEPRLFYQAFAQVGGIIESIEVEEGDTVAKGDVIAKIKRQAVSLGVDNAKLQYELAKSAYEGESAIINEIQQQIDIAKTKLYNDSINFERQKKLWEQNIGSKSALEQREMAFDISRRELERLNNSFRRTKIELEQKVEMARNSLEINQINESEYVLKSKLSGRVYRVYKELGETVNAQTPIVYIGSSDDFILTLQIDEVDISKIQLGQEIIIALDAYPDSIYKARVEKIYPEKDERSLTVKVEAEFTTRPRKLLKGLSGEANIIIQERKNVLTIPSQYLSSENTVLTKDGYVHVEIGLRSLEFTEIVSGIDSSIYIKMME